MTPCRRWDTGASVGLNLDFARVHTKTQNLIDPCFGAKTWSFPIKTEVKWGLGIYIQNNKTLGRVKQKVRVRSHAIGLGDLSWSPVT